MNTTNGRTFRVAIWSSFNVANTNSIPQFLSVSITFCSAPVCVLLKAWNQLSTRKEKKKYFLSQAKRIVVYHIKSCLPLHFLTLFVSWFLQDKLRRTYTAVSTTNFSLGKKIRLNIWNNLYDVTSFRFCEMNLVSNKYQMLVFCSALISLLSLQSSILIHTGKRITVSIPNITCINNTRCVIVLYRPYGSFS
jgi:hypothetical protein